MDDGKKKKGLGRGLGALIGMNPDARLQAAVAGTPAITLPAVETIVAPVEKGERLLQLDPRDILPNPKQPRKAFNEDSLEELSESIRQNGLQEPVIVRKSGDFYELVSGERRVRASVMADMETVPAVCREVSDRDMLLLGLIENIQREDLNPIETALAYQALIEEFDWTQEQLAERVGKKRVTVTNLLRLLNLPGDVQQQVVEGALTMGHARALLALVKPEAQRAAARKIIAHGLSVRQAEKLAAPREPKPRPADTKDANVTKVETELRNRFNTKVTVKHGTNNRGRIEIEYYTLDDLDRILAVVRGGR